MGTFEDQIAADNAAMLDADEFAQDVVYRRPSTGTAQTIRAITETGDLSMASGVRSADKARHRTGRLFLTQTALADFGSTAEYRDEVDISGHTWKVLNTVSEEFGLLELAIERDVRPMF